MDYQTVFQISAAGMGVEKLRLDVAALNLANMHSTTPVGTEGFKPLRVVSRPVVPGFGTLMELQGGATLGGVTASAVVETQVAPRVVHDPAHPHADAKGNVNYPGVDHTAEMLNIMTALRAYEANVAAIGAAKAMASRALEIGGQS